jgi:hypothetical protein
MNFMVNYSLDYLSLKDTFTALPEQGQYSEAGSRFVAPLCSAGGVPNAFAMGYRLSGSENKLTNARSN